MRFFLLLIALLFPFALYETITGDAPLLRIAAKIGDSFRILNQQPRLGLERAQVVFDHSIPFGSFVAAGLGPAFYLTGSSLVRRLGWCGLVGAMTLFSVSSGAIISYMFQTMLIGWDLVTRGIRKRWTILTVLGVTAYVVVDAISSRTPFHVVIRFLAFSADSAFNRIRIFEWGMVNISDNPVFGIGMGEWVRASWMGNSVDNFWLLLAMRHGLPMFIMFSVAILWIIRSVSLRDFGTGRARLGQAAYLVSLGGLVIAGMTVHYWNALFAFFMFFLGSGIWATWAEEEDGEDQTDAATRSTPASPYSPNLQLTGKSDRPQGSPWAPSTSRNQRSTGP